MKKIFVTVAEFLENGEIPIGRSVYIKDGEFYEVGTFVGIKDESMSCLKTNRSDSYPFYNNTTFLEIDCTPHYV